MEEDQELKHACKLCNKSFPCGRSLGGHMRSHVLNSAELTDDKHQKKVVRSFNNGGNNASADTGYGLRENPKKNCRFADSNEDALFQDKLCRECGKGFQSWKALFGHMKCHSDYNRVSNSVEEDSILESQSENETAVPNRRKRSRRIKRYIATTTTTTNTTTSSSLSIANASPAVSEIEQEQEEVAICLMMLSRDVSNLNSLSESSDKDFDQFIEVDKIKGKSSMCNGGDFVKFKKLRNRKLESIGNVNFGKKKSELGACEMIKSEVPVGGILGNGKLKVSEVGLEKTLIKESEYNQAELSSKKNHSSKRKSFDLFDPELSVDCIRKLAYAASDSQEVCKDSDKKSKFDCGTCKRSFHSYQALGGHRASHKKMKGCCYTTRIDGNENSIEADRKLIKSCSSYDNINPIDYDTVASYGEKVETSFVSKKNRVHECPICFRVFSSGQALGGHKRSHLISGGSESKSNQSSIVIPKPIPEIRDFLDLNMPAPAEEESSTTGHVGFKPWWVGSNHSHEPLVGLLLN
ncbi:hypothetical protein RJ639_045150 [Escallonia herrerae]|uniref:C2H2-type domain-containing protein n=1 Tax=Escallonia herrerae TaxID=1293975 RepID=A0AA88W810_9ASTE|nr:hypothetical protein RJ639_045150 [Escallonia herrerae]